MGGAAVLSGESPENPSLDLFQLPEMPGVSSSFSKPCISFLPRLLLPTAEQGCSAKACSWGPRAATLLPHLWVPNPSMSVKSSWPRNVTCPQILGVRTCPALGGIWRHSSGDHTALPALEDVISLGMTPANQMRLRRL